MGRRILAGLGYLAAGILLAEALVRLLGLGPRAYPAPMMLENADKSYGVECYPTDPDGRFPLWLRSRDEQARVAREGWLSPRALWWLSRVLPHCVEFRYNPQRCRSGPFPAQPDGRARVLVIGDSFSEGAGVRVEHTYARRLEELLRGVRAGVAVDNCGRRGRDLPGLREALRRLLPVARPQVVVYAFMLNDFQQDASYRRRQRFLNDLVLDRQHMGHPTWKLPRWLRFSRLATILAERWRSRQVTRATVRWYQGMTGPDNRAGWARTRADLAAMKRRVEASGAKFLVAILPVLARLDSYPFTHVHRELASACRKLGIEHVDLLPVFRGRDARTLWVHRVDMHPNGTAHRIIARALAPAVKRLLGATSQ
ncbi:MAG: SGNH/GDSL hydrolase family protein [bacterium]